MMSERKGLEVLLGAPALYTAVAELIAACSNVGHHPIKSLTDPELLALREVMQTAKDHLHELVVGSYIHAHDDIDELCSSYVMYGNVISCFPYDTERATQLRNQYINALHSLVTTLQDRGYA